MSSIDECPGRYCGWNSNYTQDDQPWEECSACPPGYRTNTSKYCMKCNGNPVMYQWMYLGFMTLLPLIFHWLYIFYIHQELKKSVTIQLISASFEICLAIFVSLLLFEPQGSLNITSCSVHRLSDWYTVFFNPKIKYSKTLHCSQEAVYPLYSIIFVFYLFALLMMLLIRPIISFRVITKGEDRKKSHKAMYAAMYFHPILIVIHAVAAGLIYYSYPYVMILATLVGVVIYCVQWEATTVQLVFGKDKFQHIFIITWHLLMLSYAVLSIGGAYSKNDMYTPKFENLIYLVVVPVPLAFFLFTEKFTDPNNIDSEIIGHFA